jgi:glyoxylase-like metal-dependent hydrolase (beta-lactamase superfamily II)
MFANSYVVLSESGSALVLDFGYDLTTTATSTERQARRTLMWSIEALKRDYGVERVEVAIPTHFHDDHVAGLNLLRELEGAAIWVPENVAPILAEPTRYDLPCLWFDPIAADRVLALGGTVRWHEHELTVHGLPGHTRFAAAVELEVDGTRVLATGDHHAETAERPVLNFQYRNRFDPEDFVRGAELYRRLRPDLVISGHWQPRAVDDRYLDDLERDARRLAELHRELLPEQGFGTDGFGARIEPYRAPAGAPVAFDVIVRNPFDREEHATVRLSVPPEWTVEPTEREATLDAKAETAVTFSVVPTGPGRLAADLTVGGTRFGEQAEAVVEAP